MEYKNYQVLHRYPWVKEGTNLGLIYLLNCQKPDDEWVLCNVRIKNGEEDPFSQEYDEEDPSSPKREFKPSSMAYYSLYRLSAEWASKEYLSYLLSKINKNRKNHKEISKILTSPAENLYEMLYTHSHLVFYNIIKTSIENIIVALCKNENEKVVDNIDVTGLEDYIEGSETESKNENGKVVDVLKKIRSAINSGEKIIIPVKPTHFTIDAVKKAKPQIAKYLEVSEDTYFKIILLNSDSKDHIFACLIDEKKVAADASTSTITKNLQIYLIRTKEYIIHIKKEEKEKAEVLTMLTAEDYKEIIKKQSFENTSIKDQGNILFDMLDFADKSPASKLFDKKMADLEINELQTEYIYEIVRNVCRQFGFYVHSYKIDDDKLYECVNDAYLKSYEAEFSKLFSDPVYFAYYVDKIFADKIFDTVYIYARNELRTELIEDFIRTNHRFPSSGEKANITKSLSAEKVLIRAEQIIMDKSQDKLKEIARTIDYSNIYILSMVDFLIPFVRSLLSKDYSYKLKQKRKYISPYQENQETGEIEDNTNYYFFNKKDNDPLTMLTQADSFEEIFSAIKSSKKKSDKAQILERVFILYGAGFKQKEIASILKISTSAVSRYVIEIRNIMESLGYKVRKKKKSAKAAKSNEIQ